MNLAKFERPSFVIASDLDELQYPALPGYTLRTSADTGTPFSTFEAVTSTFIDETGVERQWGPVANLTITRETCDGTQILLCIRHPEDEVHPNVVSTPTLR